jgi:hypothetical protein
VDSPVDALNEVPARFKLVNALPAALFVCTIGVLLLSGAPQEAPAFDHLLESARRFGWAGAAAAVGFVAVGAVLLEPLELASIRLLEGYWSAWGPLRRAADLGRWVQRRKLERLKLLTDVAQARSIPSADIDAELLNFPSSGALLPTALGNRLRAFEERAGRAYGLQAIVLWPRLYYVLPDTVLSYVARTRNQLDTASRLCLTLMLSAAAAAVLLATHPLWWLVPLAMLAGAAVAYRSALAAAGNFGVAVTAAIDVYRLRLLQELRVDMPVDTAGERTINDQLSLLWAGEKRAGVRYAPADSDIAVYLQALRRDQP